jgi:hypothetical protein
MCTETMLDCTQTSPRCQNRRSVKMKKPATVQIKRSLRILRIGRLINRKKISRTFVLLDFASHRFSTIVIAFLVLHFLESDCTVLRWPCTVCCSSTSWKGDMTCGSAHDACACIGASSMSVYTAPLAVHRLLLLHVMEGGHDVWERA